LYSTVKEDASLSVFTERELDQMVHKAWVDLRNTPSSDNQPAPAATKLSAADVARMIDHTLLQPDATEKQIQQLCR
jgi:hypothetical protein